MDSITFEAFLSAAASLCRSEDENLDAILYEMFDLC